MKWLYESKLALRAIDQACHVFGTNLYPNKSWTKDSERDVATDLDMHLESEIIKVLEPSGLPILAEETQQNASGDPLWVVDPLDGTVNYLHGIPYYASSVGLIANGECEVGAVVLPAFQEIYFTHGTEAAYLNGKKLQMAATDEGMLIGAAFGSKLDEEAARYSLEFFARVNSQGHGCLRLGSATALTCLVAKGSLQGAYGFGVKIWDVAGGLAICRRAGYEVVINQCQTPNKVDFFVGSPKAHEMIRKIQRQIAPN